MTNGSTTSSEPRAILVRAPNWVGDVLMATPALRALRLGHPNARLVVSGRAHVEALVSGLPTLDAFVCEPRRGLGALFAHARELARQSFDWAVLLPDSTRSALPAFLARVPVRIGYAREVVRRTLLTRPLEPPRDEAGGREPISMVERYLRITRALGCADAGPELELAVAPDARARVADRLKGLGLSDADSLLVVTPGASFGSSKLWPPEHFASACDGLARERSLRTVLAPGPGEEAIAAEIVARMQTPGANLADPVTTLSELAALIERAALVLSNDTGPRHMAVALGRPVVTVMGPTDPRHTAHLLERQRVLREPVDCSPCHKKVCPIDHRCMTRLGPERVVAAGRELLG